MDNTPRSPPPRNLATPQSRDVATPVHELDGHNPHRPSTPYASVLPVPISVGPSAEPADEDNHIESWEELCEAMNNCPDPASAQKYTVSAAIAGELVKSYRTQLPDHHDASQLMYRM